LLYNIREYIFMFVDYFLAMYCFVLYIRNLAMEEILFSKLR